MTSTAVVPMTASIGGVRTFFSPVGVTAKAVLTFRVGWADETLAMHGVSHLVEHLVLAPLGQPAFAWNGMTTPERMAFYCEGTPEQVTWFLEAVAANIRALPLQHLDVERRLLRTEACHRSSGLAGLHDLWRWGAQGHGLGGYDEHGLPHLTADQVRAWAARFLTADNAVLWMTCPPPAGLELPRGERVLAPRPPVQPATPLPGVIRPGVGTVSLSCELREGDWAGVVGWLLEQRLMARLRYVDGVTYGVRGDVEQVAGDRRRLLVVVDGLPDRLPDVARGTVEVVEELARNGPTLEELRNFVENYRRATSGDGAAVAELSRLADCVLTGREIQSPQQLLAELEALTPERLRAGLARGMQTALWCVPTGIEVPGIPDAPQSSDVEVRGLRFTPPVGMLQTSYVDVSDDGLTVVFEGDERNAATVQWSRCVAALGYDDGSRVLIGRDGFRIALHPERWARYEELRAYVDRRIPPGTWAPQGPAPERQQPQAPLVPRQPTSDGAWWLLAAAVWALAALIGWGSVSPDVMLPGLAVTAVVAALGALPAWHVLRRRRRVRVGLGAPNVRRYRGVAVWPTWLVAVGLAPSVGLLLVGAATLRLWPAVWGVLMGLACVRELWRRHQRNVGGWRRLSP